MKKNKKKEQYQDELKKECSCGDNCHCEEPCTCDDNCTCGNECSCDNGCSNEDELLNLSSMVKALQESLLREKAEVQNYKRRKEEETDKILKYKDEDFIRELLPIIDNFERAIKMDDNDLSDEVSKFLEGFKLIYTNTMGVLNKFKVETIDAEGKEFDPTYHHAVLTSHDENKPEGVILEVLQKGYIYKDRVIRPAMVRVNE